MRCNTRDVGTATWSGARVVASVAAVVAVADWSTKALVSTILDERSIEVGSVITLRLSHNPGVAFGGGSRLPDALVIGATAAVTAVLAMAALRGLFPSAVAAGLVLGGAVANVVDRVIGGTVVDFLDLGGWPSFNVADASLSVGCVLMIVASIRPPRSSEAPAP